MTYQIRGQTTTECSELIAEHWWGSDFFIWHRLHSINEYWQDLCVYGIISSSGKHNMITQHWISCKSEYHQSIYLFLQRIINKFTIQGCARATFSDPFCTTASVLHSAIWKRKHYCVDTESIVHGQSNGQRSPLSCDNQRESSLSANKATNHTQHKTQHT